MITVSSGDDQRASMSVATDSQVVTINVPVKVTAGSCEDSRSGSPGWN